MPDPVRAIPVIGNPLADLLQTDLAYLISWGYGGPANVPAPSGLFPQLSDTTALGRPPDRIGCRIFPDLRSPPRFCAIAAQGRRFALR